MRRRVTLAIAVLIAAIGAGVTAKVVYFPSPNPLLYILAPEGIALTRQQLANPDTGRGLAEMVRLLKTTHKAVPEYLTMVCGEYSGQPHQTARFTVGCYWEGERELGKIPGVVASRTGMVGRSEVVEVQYNPKFINTATLAAKANRLKCFRGIASTQAILVEDPEQQHALANHPEFRGILLTPMQRTKVNSALSDHQNLSRFLSPLQLRLVQDQK